MIPLLALPLLILDLDLSDGSLEAAGTADQWEWGEPMAGPGTDRRAWGTMLHGLYLHDALDTLEIPLPDLTGAERPVVVLEHWYDIQAGDAGTLEVDDGLGWQRVEPVYGYPHDDGFVGVSGGWVRHAVDLGEAGPAPRLRLVFESDAMHAREGWYLGRVELWDGDVVPPHLALLQAPADTQDLDGPYVVRVEAVDDVAVTEVRVWASFAGKSEEDFVAEPEGGDAWRVELPGQPPGTEVRWYAEASDGAQQSRLPAEGTFGFRVYLAAPEGVSGPEGRVLGTEVPLWWDPPHSPHEVLDYLVRTSEGVELQADEPPAEVPVLSSGPIAFEVLARYPPGAGDPSTPLWLDVEVPILGLAPDAVHAGEQVRVQLTGHGLYLLAGATDLDLGPGVTVSALEVHGAHAATALLTLAEDAPEGPRTVHLTGAQGSATFAEAFEVLAFDDRPRILEITPDFVRQGEAVRMRVRANRPLVPGMQADPGAGLFASSVEVEGEVATFEVVAAGGAATGPRLLVLDDGERLWSAPFEVLARQPEPNRSCGTPGGGPWALLALLALARRRSTKG